MGWATRYIAKLLAGETVSFRPRGNSMRPKIESGQLCTVEPVKNHSELAPGDVVLCKVSGNEYLHYLKAVDSGRFQIANASGFVNGWVGAKSVYGKLVRVEA